jgi:Peptidyl-prolyl cis-trans isomerase (rotamase) - cyclophilin family
MTVLEAVVLPASGRADPGAPQGPLNTMADIRQALRGCWQWPPASEARSGMELTVRVSFKRNGEIFGARITYQTASVSAEERALYYGALLAALSRCSPLPLSASLGEAIAGRPFIFHIHDTRTTTKGICMASPEDTMILDTTKGRVVIAMRPDLAPGHVARIKELVREGFYDGIVFHRVIDGFMAQTGCPHGTGTGGSGKKLKAEFNKEPHVRGTVSMARAGDPNSGDSQFFICFGDATFLDNQYTAWGNVVEGMENVDKIKRGEPVRDPDKIVKATMASDAKK